MKSTLLMATLFCALGLSACGNNDFSGDFNVTKNSSSGDVSCEDVCRYAGFECSDEDYKSPCSNSESLINECMKICSSKNSSVILNLLNEYGCYTTETFMGVKCEYNKRDGGANYEEDEDDDYYKNSEAE